MKKIALMLLALGFTTLYGQYGPIGNNGPRRGNGGGNSYHGQNAGNGYQSQRPPARGGDRYTGRDYGRNSYRGNRGGHYRGNRGYNRGAVAYGGVRRAPAPRVRYEWSNCGTFRWRIQETAYWAPGYYTYVNGCRRWVEPCWRWRQTCRVRDNSCRPRRGW